MSNVLVVYATWTGATREVAEAIAAELRAAGHTVTTDQARHVKDVAPYDAVLVGTGVHAGILPRATVGFVKRFAKPLAAKKVAQFLVCLTMAEDTPENRTKALAFLAPLAKAAPAVQVVDTGLFAGAVLNSTPEYATLNPFLRAAAKGMAESLPDHRDWPAIRAWAAALASRL